MYGVILKINRLFPGSRNEHNERNEKSTFCSHCDKLDLHSIYLTYFPKYIYLHMNNQFSTTLAKTKIENIIAKLTYSNVNI